MRRLMPPQRVIAQALATLRLTEQRGSAFARMCDPMLSTLSFFQGMSNPKKSQLCIHTQPFVFGPRLCRFLTDVPPQEGYFSFTSYSTIEA